MPLNSVKALLRQAVSPSARHRVRAAAGWAQAQRKRFALWQWTVQNLQGDAQASPPMDLRYIGRADRLDLAQQLLGWRHPAPSAGPAPTAALAARSCATVTEWPTPGLLRVPMYVSTIVPLDRSLEEVTASYDSEHRRRLRKQLAVCRSVQAVSDADVDFAEREMLRPYAIARRGDGAVQLSREEVFRLAQRDGRLDIVYSGDEPVSCNLGFPVERGGQRHWVAHRYGFTEAVFSNRKRWGEINSLNNYLVLKWALDNGYEHYDIGYSVGRPDDGLLQWKKRQGGVVGTEHYFGYFHVRLPARGASDQLWRAPLFSRDGAGLHLHLGLPQGMSDEAFLARYREMGFDGLAGVRLHAAREPSDALVAGLLALYRDARCKPALLVTREPQPAAPVTAVQAERIG